MRRPCFVHTRRLRWRDAARALRRRRRRRPRRRRQRSRVRRSGSRQAGGSVSSAASCPLPAIHTPQSTSRVRMPDLLSPLDVQGLTLRNRIVMPPMWSGQAGPDGFVTPNIVEYHRRRAAAGCGLIIVEHAFVHPRGRHTPTQIGVHNDATVDGLSRLASAIRREGAVACLQNLARRLADLVPRPRDAAAGAVGRAASVRARGRHAGGDRRGDDPGHRRGVRRRRGAGAGGRIPGRRGARGARVPAQPVPVAADQPAARRVWRPRREPMPAPPGGVAARSCRAWVPTARCSCASGAHDETPGGLELADSCQAAGWLAEAGAALDRRVGRPPGVPRRRQGRGVLRALRAGDQGRRPRAGAGHGRIRRTRSGRPRRAGAVGGPGRHRARDAQRPRLGAQGHRAPGPGPAAARSRLSTSRGDRSLRENRRDILLERGDGPLGDAADFLVASEEDEGRNPQDLVLDGESLGVLLRPVHRRPSSPCPSRARPGRRS